MVCRAQRPVAKIDAIATSASGRDRTSAFEPAETPANCGLFLRDRETSVRIGLRGGAVIPTLMSTYLLVRNQLWVQAALATVAVAAVCYWLSRPIPGLGIAEPVFVPSVTTAIVALLLSREHAAPLAYIGGSLGTLIGADLLNLGNIRGLGAPVASIGGAGTFDGIFLTGIVAVLLA